MPAAVRPGPDRSESSGPAVPLVVGAQLSQPTVNVTAAVWRGASSRDREVPNTASSFDPDAFTPEHAGAAIRAGVASVLSDITGIVIWLD
jgi:hypothetical protein